MGNPPPAADALPRWRPSSFEGFELERVLYQDATTGNLGVVGRWDGQEGRAVVKLSRQHFDVAQLGSLLGAGTTMGSMTFENDIYSKFSASVPSAHALVTIDVCHPCTDKHIAKAEEQEMHMVSESAAQYASHTAPFVASMLASRLKWVYNILEKTAEAERLVFEDPDPETGFMLHPDLKWDQTTNNQLYCLALATRRGVPSLRSLTAEHLPLLRHIRERAGKAVEAKYGVPASQLRMFVHYPPSYYHLHVHVTHVKAAYGGSSAVGKAHLLDDIIENIEFRPDYYQQRTLSFVVGVNDELWKVVESWRKLGPK
ncbi:hypothetical protein FOA52_006340 [Chlamydomonas sp. UWO 241]|nr:hypothetical protein FOA52_006340 [Chlamydomonas sp. UWO 241]